MDVGYNLYVFDIRYQRNFTASQPIKVEVLTNKLVGISSDGQRYFDLI